MEQIIDGIESLTFRYFTDDNPTSELSPATSSLDNAADVFLIQVELTLSRESGNGRILKHTAKRKVWLANAGGLFNEAPADGGCDPPDRCGW